jgi:hypothetical protein
MNCFLKSIKEKIEGRIEMMERRGRIRVEPLEGLQENTES